MNIKTAIKTLKDMRGYFNDRSHRRYSVPAIDLAIEALEKQIPKKPIKTYELGYTCPNCKGGWIYSPEITDSKHQHCNYCNECGQLLDWEAGD